MSHVTFPSLLPFPLTGGRINRCERERRGRHFLAERTAPAAKPHVIVCRSPLTPGFPSSIWVKDKGNPAHTWMTPLEPGSGRPIVDLQKAVFVGQEEVYHRNVFITTPENVDKTYLEQGNFLDTRVLFSKLSSHELCLMGLALSMLNWVEAVRFCPRCGGPLEVRDYGMFQKCTKCAELEFPRTNPAMIVCVLDGRGNVLLSQRKRKSFKSGDKVMKTVLSGFVSHGESVEDTVVREVKEESAAVVTSVRYVGSAPWPYPYQQMHAYFALADRSPDLVLEAEELTKVEWVSKEEVRKALAGEHPQFFVPPTYSAAGLLLSAWVEGLVDDRGELVRVVAKL